jgi:hypothetical protein
MAAITSASSTDDVVSLTLDDSTGLVAGEHVHIYGTGYSKLDGHHDLTSVNLGTNVVTYSVNNQDDIAAFTPSNGVLVDQVTWITTEDVAEFLGETPTGADATWLESCTDAANTFAATRRGAAGYSDNPTVAPSSAVRLGAMLYAGALYRERGSVDSYQSFQDLPIAGPVGSMGQIMRLLGIGRMAVG